MAKHNNQMSAITSDKNSPKRQPPKYDESINYTERSRSEELEQLDEDKRAAFMEYAESKRKFASAQNNPFFIESKRTDIDPFKEFLSNRKTLLKSSEEFDDIKQMYDDENMFMNRISNLKEFRKLIQEYKAMGIEINDDISLDNDSLDDFKDGTIL